MFTYAAIFAGSLSDFNVFFFNCTLLGQLSQYNLAKLFRMKSKTTKCS